MGVFGGVTPDWERDFDRKASLGKEPLGSGIMAMEGDDGGEKYWT